MPEGEERFYGYCFMADGRRMSPPALLIGPETALGFVNLQKDFFPRVIVNDAADMTVIEAIWGEISFKEAHPSKLNECA